MEEEMSGYKDCLIKYENQFQEHETELDKEKKKRKRLDDDIKSMKIEKKAKLKFLAASLAFISNQQTIQKKKTVREAFWNWKFEVLSHKIAESAFNKVLELNHKHSKSRFESAFYLLSKVQEKKCFHNLFGAFRALNSDSHFMTGSLWSKTPGRLSSMLESRVYY
jgi:hypothetical protein